MKRESISVSSGILHIKTETEQNQKTTGGPLNCCEEK